MDVLQWVLSNDKTSDQFIPYGNDHYRAGTFMSIETNRSSFLIIEHFPDKIQTGLFLY